MPLAHKKHFNGSKLKFARELRGYTLKCISENMNVSHQLISKWENGKATPNLAQQVCLSDILDINRLFFWSDCNIPSSTSNIFFRKALSVPKRNQKIAENIVSLYSYIDEVISNDLGLRYYKINKSIDRLHSIDEIELYANEVRKKFGLGIGPISNMTLLLEKMGIRVVFCDLSHAQVDAITDELNNKIYIAINNKKSSVRTRFNLAHELGHVLLHQGFSSKELKEKDIYKRVEEEAQYFAGCLLMPEKGLALDMSRTNLNYLIELKKHWKVSIQSLITRGNQIGLIDNNQALYQRQEISRRNWRKNEPLDDIMTQELPSLIYSALKFNNKLNDKYIHEISTVLGLDDTFIKHILNLDKYMKQKKDEVKLKLI